MVLIRLIGRLCFIPSGISTLLLQPVPERSVLSSASINWKSQRGSHQNQPLSPTHNAGPHPQSTSKNQTSQAESRSTQGENGTKREISREWIV